MPSVLDTLPTKTVDPGYLGTGQTLQPNSIQTRTQLDEFLHASYVYETARLVNTKATYPSYLYGSPAFVLDSSRQDYQEKSRIFLPIFIQYGVIPDSEGYANWRGVLTQSFGIDPNQVVLTYPFADVGQSGLDPFAVGFQRLYGLDYTNETQFKSDILGGSSSWYRPRSTGSGGFGNIFDRVLSGGFIKTFVENPISAITGFIDRFSNPVGTNLPQFIKAGIDPPKVDYRKLGIESGVNTIANIGFAYGVQGVTQGIQAGVSASAPLPAGTLGPVSPGFWSSVGQGNFRIAWQILGNTVGVATGGPTNFVSRQGGNLLLQQGAQQLVKLTGDVGKGILQLVTLDFAGALQTFTGGPGGGSQLLYGPASVSSGAGGGGGFLPNQNTGQTTTSSIIIPVLGLSLIGFVLWYFLRKKA